jgi:hypothetical protein
MAWIDQLTPSHPSANGKCAPVPVYPTAVHAVVDVHDTPLSLLTGAPRRVVVGLGVVWIDQPTPFHRSANVMPGEALAALLSSWNPTAVQAVADTHDPPTNPLSPIFLAAVGSGVL